MLDLLDHLLTMKTEALEVAEQNHDLKRRIGELEERLRLSVEIERDENAMVWRKTAVGKEGPYCGVCYDTKRQLIRLFPPAESGTYRYYSCGACDNTYKVSS